MKEMYTGKFVKLDFSQNLSLRPKNKVQSAHFSGRQFTLHCAIPEPSRDVGTRGGQGGPALPIIVNDNKKKLKKC